MHDVPLILVLAWHTQSLLASLISYENQSETFKWTLDGATFDASLSLKRCDDIPVNITPFDESSRTINDMFVLAQTNSGVTDLQKLSGSNGSFSYQVTSSLGEVMLTPLDFEGNTGQATVISIAEGSSNCSISSPQNVITVKSNASSSQIVEQCDTVGFQVSGGRRPYGAIVTSSSDLSTVSMLNVSLGENDDVFLLPNMFPSLQQSSTIVSFYDQDGVWSNSSNLITFNPMSEDTLRCESSMTSSSSEDVDIFSVPPDPDSLRLRLSKGVSPVVIAVPVIFGIQILIVVIFLLRKRMNKRMDDRRFPAIIPDVWSRPDTGKHELPWLESVPPSIQKVRRYFNRIPGRSIRWNIGMINGWNNGGINEQGRGWDSHTRPVFHEDAESAQDVPPPYQDRRAAAPVQVAAADDRWMKELPPLPAQQGEEDEEAQIPSGPSQRDPLLSSLGREYELSTNVSDTPIRSQPSRKGKERATN